MGEYTDIPAVHLPQTRNDAIPRDIGRVGAEFGRLGARKRAEFHERAGINKKGNPFIAGEIPLLLHFFDPLPSAAQEGFFPQFVEFSQCLFHVAHLEIPLQCIMKPSCP